MLSKRIRIIAFAFLAIIVVVAAGYFVLRRSTTASLKNGTVHLDTITQNHVQVDINLEADSLGHMILAATYKPLDEGFHLYSKDLPRTGIDGVGRPTLLELPPSSGLQPTGTVTDSVPADPVKIEGMDQPFPIYPNGPVTLRVPVKLTNADTRQAELSISYMACSLTGGCYPPVMDKVISVQLPQGS